MCGWVMCLMDDVNELCVWVGECLMHDINELCVWVGDVFDG